MNNVGPGFTATDRLQRVAKSRSAASARPKRISLTAGRGRTRCGAWATEEVADTIVWLASERASYVTGQTVLVDGGMYKGL